MTLVALWVRICICMLCIYASSVSTPGKEFPLTGEQQRGRGIAFTIPVGAKDCSNQVRCISASAALPPQLVVVRSWSLTLWRHSKPTWVALSNLLSLTLLWAGACTTWFPNSAPSVTLICTYVQIHDPSCLRCTAELQKLHELHSLADAGGAQASICRHLHVQRSVNLFYGGLKPASVLLSSSKPPRFCWHAVICEAVICWVGFWVLQVTGARRRHGEGLANWYRIKSICEKGI